MRVRIPIVIPCSLTSGMANYYHNYFNVFWESAQALACWACRPTTFGNSHLFWAVRSKLFVLLYGVMGSLIMSSQSVWVLSASDSSGHHRLLNFGRALYSCPLQLYRTPSHVTLSSCCSQHESFVQQTDVHCIVIPAAWPNRIWLYVQWWWCIWHSECLELTELRIYVYIHHSESEEHFTFVLTDLDSKYRFGFCLYRPKGDICMCIIRYCNTTTTVYLFSKYSTPATHRCFYVHFCSCAVSVFHPPSLSLSLFLSLSSLSLSLSLPVICRGTRCSTEP